MMSFGDVFMTYDEVILQRFILCGKVEKNSCFLPLNNERTSACYRLIINARTMILNYSTLNRGDEHAAREHFGETNTLELSFPRLIFTMRYQNLSPRLNRARITQEL